MTRDEYHQLVGLVRTNYAKTGAWDDPENYSMFVTIAADPVFEAYDKLRLSGRYDDFPPKPPGVARLAGDLLRNTRSLPVPDDDEERVPGWEEGRKSLGYDGMTVWEAAQHRHLELFESFEADCKCPAAKHVACHSKDCDVHQALIV